MFIFRRLPFHYEAPEDGGGALDDSEPIDDTPVASAGTDTQAEAAAWALSQDDWQQTVQYLQQTAPLLQELARVLPQMQQQGQQGFQPQQQTPAAPEIDPFDPNSVESYIQYQIQNGLQSALAEQLGPYEGMLGMVASEQGEALARQELESIKANIGEFDQDTAFLIAAGQIEGGLDPQSALRQAAQYAVDWEKKIRADERTKYQSELQNLQGAPGEIPAGGSPGAHEVQPVPTGPRRYHEAVERVLARQNPTSVVG